MSEASESKRLVYAIGDKLGVPTRTIHETLEAPGLEEPALNQPTALFRTGIEVSRDEVSGVIYMKDYYVGDEQYERARRLQEGNCLTGETAGPWNHERATTYGGIYSFGS